MKVYVVQGFNHIVIDFDLKNGNGMHLHYDTTEKKG